MASTQKNSNRVSLIVCSTFFAGFSSLALADPLGANAGMILRMGPNATLQEGCFPPCMCPIMNEQPVLGTMRITYQGLINGEHVYNVEDVNWLSPDPYSDRRIVGAGKYRIGSPGPLAVIQQRLELDLRVGGDPTTHFDSGWVPRGNNTGIDIVISINGTYCWDRVIHVVAMPVPAADLRPYGLDPGSTFQRGCIDGMCDCAVGPEVPMRGEFALVPLRSDPLFQFFAVVNVHWQAMTSNATNGIPIAGAGFYWVGGEVAAQNRLFLELRAPDPLVGNWPEDYDSGMVIGGGTFPHIDILTRTHTYCVDTLLHVIASPAGGSGDICGGIAGVPCPAGQFCKLEPGHCCCDFQGTCMPIAQACPEYFDPVCGCDGVTYANPCFADMAGQSIDHWGPCGTSCGPNGQACANNEFCKFPPGSCGTGGDQGFCAPRPDACPDVWNPVCGCDDKTYGNECEADAAGVSIAHPGECANTNCVATRVFDQPFVSHCAGMAFVVRVILNPPNSASALALEDEPPAGWDVSGVSNGGIYDATTHKVRWGPFFPPFPAEVSYFVTPSLDSNVVTCFAGTVSVDGVNEAICGESCLEACCPRMNADLPHDACGSCPVTDCNSCDASLCGDARIHMCEIVGYACAWLHGCHDDLAGMTRAAFIWRTGECYCWDDAANNWYPTDCTTPSPDGCCGNPADLVANTGETGVAYFGGTLLTRGASQTGDVRMVWVVLDVPRTASAVALEINVPKGWKVANISDGGVWDANTRKIKWGVFFDDLSRMVTFTAYGAAKAHIRDGMPNLATTGGQWSGTVSVDGVNSPLIPKKR